MKAVERVGVAAPVLLACFSLGFVLAGVRGSETFLEGLKFAAKVEGLLVGLVALSMVAVRVLTTLEDDLLPGLARVTIRARVRLSAADPRLVTTRPARIIRYFLHKTSRAEFDCIVLDIDKDYEEAKAEHGSAFAGLIAWWLTLTAIAPYVMRGVRSLILNGTLAAPLVRDAYQMVTGRELSSDRDEPALEE